MVPDGTARPPYGLGTTKNHFWYGQRRKRHPLPGATVIIEGTTQGVATDFDGNFSIQATQGDVLIVSYVGYADQRISIGNQDTYIISLQADSQLEEVVVTALGISREKKALGYSVQEISGEQVSEVKDGNIANLLSGKVAGVQINGSPGTVGGSSRILLRGVNSITGNNQPLWVVDGTPIDSSGFNSSDTQRGSGGIDFGNTSADINPDDIESISVLKGASAAALYGSRAANGVILVTTKKGLGNYFGWKSYRIRRV